MRSVLKACDLEDRFPILAVENNCIVSKDADITVAFEVELPELYTVTAAEYEAIHGTWVKAMKVLPNYSVVYKQDWFVKENYRSEGDGTESFLSRSYERHFNERPYLRHRCFLYLTKTTRERARRRSDFSTLCRGYILPKEITDWDSVVKFLEAVEQFERIMNDSGHVRMKRLRTEEVVGTEECPGLIERYLTLGMEDTHPVLQDICLDPERMRIGDKRLCLHVLSDTEDLPGSVGTDMRYERLSTDRSDCRLSFAAPVGLLLSCNHVYSQYVFIDDAQEILQRMEKTSRNMLSLSKYSRSNAVNYEWAEMYLDEAHTKGLVPVISKRSWIDSFFSFPIIVFFSVIAFLSAFPASLTTVFASTPVLGTDSLLSFFSAICCSSLLGRDDARYFLIFSPPCNTCSQSSG